MKIEIKNSVQQIERINVEAEDPVSPPVIRKKRVVSILNALKTGSRLLT